MQINLKHFLKLHFNILSFCGYWTPDSSNPTRYKIYSTILLFSTLIILTLTETINVIFQLRDLEKLTDASFLLLTHYVQIIKFSFFIMRSKQIEEMLYWLEYSSIQPTNKKQEKMLQDGLKIIGASYYFFLVLVALTIILWGVYPVLDSGYSKIHLPLSAWYPFPTDGKLIFSFMYAYQLLAVFACAFANATFDVLCASFMAIARGQLDILNDMIENLNKYSRHGKNLCWIQEKTSKTEQTDIYFYLEKCIDHHRSIRLLIKKIESVFGIGVFGQFVASSTIICLTLFYITYLVEFGSMKFFSMILYQGCMLAEIFLYCWYGHEIIDKVCLIYFNF